jgi:DNA ligase-1
VKRLVTALEAARKTRSRIAKEEILGAALRTIAEDRDPAAPACARDDVALAIAARLSVGVPLAIGDPRPLGVGWSLLQEIVVARTGWPDPIVRECARTCGDLGEAFGLLLAREPRPAPGVGLHEVGELFEALAGSSQRAQKRARLDDVFARTTPLEAKYLAKAFLDSIRVGVQGGILEGAIARAFDRPIEQVRKAAAIVTDPGALAILARDDRLAEARVEIGRPIAYMLATPLESIASPIDPALHVVEDKIDGVRAQIHKRAGEVEIFARGLDRVTDAYPEIVEAFQFVRGSVALDGEIVAIAGDRPRPFQALQVRLRKIAPDAELLAAVPVAFFAYDLLADDDGDHLAEPWHARRERLVAFAEERGPRSAFVVNPVRPLGDGALTEILDREFERARARGHEGLVLKRADAAYDAGRRGQAWIKVKKAFATLDVVITAAEEGHGRRAGVLSDYTFGVWRDGELVNVGKAFTGLTDAEVDALTKRLEKLTTERYGGVRAIRPSIVLEVGFDGIQRSSRHKSGYALRFPRIHRIRDDKSPEEADRIGAVEDLFRAQLETGHREIETARKARPSKQTAAKPSAQLSLFGAQEECGKRRR